MYCLAQNKYVSQFMFEDKKKILFSYRSVIYFDFFFFYMQIEFNECLLLLTAESKFTFICL